MICCNTTLLVLQMVLLFLLLPLLIVGCWKSIDPWPTLLSCLPLLVFSRVESMFSPSEILTPACAFAISSSIHNDSACSSSYTFFCIKVAFDWRSANWTFSLRALSLVDSFNDLELDDLDDDGACRSGTWWSWFFFLYSLYLAHCSLRHMQSHMHTQAHSTHTSTFACAIYHTCEIIVFSFFVLLYFPQGEIYVKTDCFLF